MRFSELWITFNIETPAKMEIPPKELIYIISLGSLMFLIAPFFLLLYVISYNNKKRTIMIEQERLRMSFQTELLKAGMEVREQTMQTIGADLHDNIGQLLSLTSLTLASVEVSNAEKAEQKITTIKELVSKSIYELRQLGKIIQGDQLVQGGLAIAIQYELNRVEKSGLFKTSFAHRGTTQTPSHDKDLILFRLFQETLSNSIKHSHGNAIEVELLHQECGVTLRISDNGQGFDRNAISDHSDGMGLQNMERRAAVAGGKAFINSGGGHGTQIVITLPYP